MRKRFKYLPFLLISFVLAGCSQGLLPTDKPAQLSDIVLIIGNVISLLAPLAGIAFFAMLIYGGFQLMMAGGDPKAAAGAKNTFTFAVLGIILVVVVWLLLLLVEQVTGIQDLTFVRFIIE